MLERLTRLFVAGKIDEAGLQRAVSLGWISPEQAEAII